MERNVYKIVINSHIVMNIKYKVVNNKNNDKQKKILKVSQTKYAY